MDIIKTHSIEIKKVIISMKLLIDNGLSSEEVYIRLEKYGKNELKKENNKVFNN